MGHIVRHRFKSSFSLNKTIKSGILTPIIPIIGKDFVYNNLWLLTPIKPIYPTKNK